MDVVVSIITTILTSPEFAAVLLTSLVTIVGFVAKWAVSLIKKNLSASELATLLSVAKVAVTVVEQTGKALNAADKKAEAMAVAQTYLDAYGMKVSVAQLSAAIEAAVYSEIGQFDYERLAPADDDDDENLPF